MKEAERKSLEKELADAKEKVAVYDDAFEDAKEVYLERERKIECLELQLKKNSELESLRARFEDLGASVRETVISSRTLSMRATTRTAARLPKRRREARRERRAGAQDARGGQRGKAALKQRIREMTSDLERDIQAREADVEGRKR